MRVIVAGPRLRTLRALEARYPGLIARLREQVCKRLLELPPGSVVVHGDGDGVDAMAKEGARRAGLVDEAHPADWNFWRLQGKPRAAGPVRNRQMVRRGADLLIIWWLGEARAAAETPGTLDTRTLCKTRRPLPIPVEERDILAEAAA
jgi:hypothetical protein